MISSTIEALLFTCKRLIGQIKALERGVWRYSGCWYRCTTIAGNHLIMVPSIDFPGEVDVTHALHTQINECLLIASLALLFGMESAWPRKTLDRTALPYIPTLVTPERHDLRHLDLQSRCHIPGHESLKQASRCSRVAVVGIIKSTPRPQ